MLNNIPTPDQVFPDKPIDSRRREAIDKTNRTKNKDKTIENYALDVEGVVDVLDAGDKLVYLTTEGEVKEKIVLNDITYSPPPKNEIPYLLPDKERVLSLINDSSDTSDTDKDIPLYTQLLNYHKEISDLPNELYYDLLVLWDFHTYLIEKIHYSPILYLYAVKERGKSRTGKGCIYVARRGIFAETVREPDLIRWGNDHRAVIGFDAKDFPKKIQRANCDDLILARFEKGATASRTLFPERGAFRDTKTFKLFGPTIVMTNRPVDDILESRTISIDMKPSIRKFNHPVLPEDALELKAQLTAFRFRKRDINFPENDKPADGRLGDILSPLSDIATVCFPNKLDLFTRLVKLIGQQKKEDAVDTFEAQVVEAVMNAEAQVVDGFVSVELIASLFNEGKNENFAVKTETIGRILRGLGFTSRRTTGGKRGIYYDPEMVKTVAYQYGLVDMDVSHTVSLPSLVSPTEPEDESQFEEVVEENDPNNPRRVLLTPTKLEYHTPRGTISLASKSSTLSPDNETSFHNPESSGDRDALTILSGTKKGDIEKEETTTEPSEEKAAVDDPEETLTDEDWEKDEGGIEL